MCEECGKVAAIQAMIRMARRLGISQGVGIVLLQETAEEEGSGPAMVFIGNLLLTFHVGDGPEYTVNLLSECSSILNEMIETGEASRRGGAIWDFDGTILYTAFIGGTTDENVGVAELATDVFEAVMTVWEAEGYLDEVFGEDDEGDKNDEAFDRTFDE